MGDDAIVSAAPPASASARKETRVGGHGLLLYACSGSQLVGLLVAAFVGRAEERRPQRQASAIRGMTIHPAVVPGPGAETENRR